MRKWFTADLHLGETRMAIMNRPFSGPKENDDTVIRGLKSRVKKDDVVYFLGDVVYKGSPESISRVADIVCAKKILLRGNHDVGLTDADLLEYFDEVHPEGVVVHETIGEITRVAMNHYPTQGIVGHFNLVGHVHSTWRVQLNTLNVGVDANHFLPLSEEDVIGTIEAISKHYDRDIWAAYEHCNAAYMGIRGASGRYLDK